MSENYVEVEIRMDNNGNFSRKIIRNGQSTCEQGDEKVFLDDLFNIQLPGYTGEFGKVNRDGLTEEGECDVNAKLKAVEVNTPYWTPEPENEEKKSKEKDKKMDLGFGV